MVRLGRWLGGSFGQPAEVGVQAERGEGGQPVSEWSIARLRSEVVVERSA